MPDYVLSFKPATTMFGSHDPSAAISRDDTIVFGIEEERLTRTKHASGTFPRQAIEACLDYADVTLGELDRILVPYLPKLRTKIFAHEVKRTLDEEDGLVRKLGSALLLPKHHLVRHRYPLVEVEERLSALSDAIPPVEMREHHACHAASAFHPSGFSEALVLTVDGRGEYDSTVVWHGTETGLERVRTYEYPNSLGTFYAIVTEFLGYRAFNGEGKVMGLAPYGSRNEAIESTIRSLVDIGADYDVTPLTEVGREEGVRRLEAAFSRERNRTAGKFDEWEQDLAHTAQKLLEETVLDIVETYIGDVGTDNVALAGGVALNCKLNKRIMNSERIDEVFIQPVAHDAGLALGALLLNQSPDEVQTQSTVYYGPEYDAETIRPHLENDKLEYAEPDDVARYTAEKLADGNLVGWFQGRMEMGPRALGNRSILADPRTETSLDRVNEFVKHREKWRPFAPSMVERAMDDYLVNAEPSPYMIKTFDTVPERREEITAVVHPADKTTRPQTVREDQNPRYYSLIEEFERITGIPVVLNTSFNDHGEPIVMTPSETIKDFFGMGLDVLVLEDFVLEK